MASPCRVFGLGDAKVYLLVERLGRPSYRQQSPYLPPGSLRAATSSSPLTAFIKRDVGQEDTEFHTACALSTRRGLKMMRQLAVRMAHIGMI
ncbi:hypothetical protein PT974_09978 [Cladobotryum mycophilum]|uniref:Uncharacterized protein n=1 Tax=Cladobotryum mycophilum TaxID=491253 RepID=A0ABR0S8K5_9HYPO